MPNAFLSGPLSNVDNSFIVADSFLRNIYQVDPTSGATGQLLPFGMASAPAAVADDAVAKLLYWTDVGVRTINRYSLATNSSIVIYADPAHIGKFNFEGIFFFQFRCKPHAFSSRRLAQLFLFAMRFVNDRFSNATI